MRTELVVGAIVSVAFHATFLLGTTPRRPDITVISPPKEDDIMQIVMPPIPPDEEELPVEKLEEEAPAQQAPPMLADVPSPRLTPIQVPLTPPPPPGIPKGDLTQIPVTRQTGVAGGARLNIFNPRDLDQQPSLASPVQPVYPMRLRSEGISGSVTVEFVVTSTGRTSNATVMHSTDREFERAALDAVHKWQFRPGRKAGRAVNTRVQQVISFNLNES